MSWHIGRWHHKQSRIQVRVLPTMSNNSGLVLKKSGQLAADLMDYERVKIVLASNIWPVLQGLRTGLHLQA